MTITAQEADERFARRMTREFEPAVRAAVQVQLTQRQFNALVSIFYNAGVDAMAGSTLVRLLNAGDFGGAAAQFPRWNKSGGVVLKGLQRRREAERLIFLGMAAEPPSPRRRRSSHDLACVAAAELEAAAIGVFTATAFFWARHQLAQADAQGYERSQAEYQARAELQRETNRGRARVAEEKHAARTVYRDRFITNTVKEIRDVPSDGTGCLVAPRVVRLLNDAAACAREDRPGACSVHELVPGAR